VVTPFAAAVNDPTTGLSADIPGQKLANEVSATLLVGQNEEAYAGSIYVFSMKITNPMIKKGYMMIESNFQIWPSNDNNEDYLLKIIDCTDGCLNSYKRDDPIDQIKANPNT
jgi:hypothetical protein